jgi:glycosyltransferase involved in cell wall biosynthesis
VIAIARTLIGLAALVRRHQIALVHCNAIGRVALYAGLVGRWRRVPVLWHVRVAERESLLDRLLVSLMRAVIVNSKAVGGRFPWARPHKVRCIYNGVDLARFQPRHPPGGLCASLGLPVGVPVVASVGRFVPYKGYTHLLKAARLVQEAMANVHWLLVGDGELREELEGECRSLGLEAQVHFVGWREDIPDLLAVSDLFVLPSLGEHFGRVLIEAMAMGRAVVATDAGGVPEIVIHGETGLLVPPGEPKALAEAVLALLEDPARAARLGGAGRRRAESEFSLSRHVEAVEALYREVLGDDRGGL